MLCWVVLPATALLAVLGSLLFSGIGHGLAGYRWRAIALAASAALAMLLVVVSVWFVPVTLLIRIASAVDAYRLLRKNPAPWQSRQHVSAALAFTIGAVAFGAAGASLEAFKIPSSSMYPTLVIGDHVYIDKLSLRWRPPERGEIIVFTQPCMRQPFIKRVMAVGGDTIEVRCSVVYVNGKAATSTLIEKDAHYSDLDVTGGEWLSRTADRYREVLDGHAYETFRNPEIQERGDFPQRDRMLLPSCTQGDFYDKPTQYVKQPRGELVPTRDLATAQPCEPQLHFVVPNGSLFVMGDNRHNANDSRYWGVVPLELVIGRAIGIYLSDGPDGGWSRFGAVE